MALTWLLACLPLIIILIAMTVFRWGAAKAGPAGWLAALIISLTTFGAAPVIPLAQVKALLLSIDILLIIWAAFLLYKVADEAGAIQTISTAVARLTPERVMQALLIGWALASFMQGVGGFGVPVAVTAPLLVGLGFPPLEAVLIPSIGHAWSVTFGSLAISFQVLIATTGIPGEILAPTCALLLAFAGYLCGTSVVHIAGGWRALPRYILTVLILGTVMGAAQYGLAVNGLWNIAGLGAGLTGLAVGIAISHWRRNRSGVHGEPPVLSREVVLALSGYISLVFLTILVLFIRQHTDILDSLVIRADFPELITTQGYSTPAGLGREIYLLRHAGTILLLSSVISFLVYRRSGRYAPGAGSRIVKDTVRRVMSSSLGILALVSMSVIMLHSGMTEALAVGLTRLAGDLFPLISSWIGALGAFMTGSNTNSNVLFANLQMRAAELLGFTLTVILAAQTTGGAVGSVIAPTKIVVGASPAGMEGQEGLILRRLSGYVAWILAMVSIMVWVAA